MLPTVAHLALAATAQLSPPARTFNVLDALTSENGDMPCTDADSGEAVGKSLVRSVSLSAYGRCVVL